MSRSSYQTKQKAIILNYLENNKDAHLTIAQITHQLEKDDIKISLPTVYRYMKHLVNEGIVNKYLLDENIGYCYQYNNNDNMSKGLFHFRCEKCKKLLHFQNKELQNIALQMKEKESNRINLMETVFSGICKDCEEKI